jgi:tetratricopeptide (TPR) repeat protein
MQEAEGLFAQATQAWLAGNQDRAARFCEEVVSAAPGFLPARILLAKHAALSGNLNRSRELLSPPVGEDLSDPAGLLMLAQSLSEIGEKARAVAFLERAVGLAPHLIGAHLLLGRLFLESGQPMKALASFDAAIGAEPRDPQSYHLKGQALRKVKRDFEAAEAFQKALSLSPRAPAPMMELGHLYFSKGNFERAEETYRKVHEMQPEAPWANYFLARALAELNRLDEAEALLQTLTAGRNASAEAALLLARVKQQLGAFDEAEQALVRIAQGDGQCIVEAQCMRIRGRKMGEADRLFLEELVALASEDKQSPEDRRLLHYALGKGFDDLANYEAAIRHYDEANRLSKIKLEADGRCFNGAHLTRTVDRIVSQCSRAYVFESPGGSDSEQPVFIVGMARSGTTLIEQMLSMHPEIGSAGELGDWIISSGPLLGQARPDPETLRQVASAYLDRLTRGSSLRRFTEKSPQNYLYLGYILATFPGARIIHCRRDPLDTCLSIYTTPFNRGPEFAHDQGALVDAYRQYLRVMTHWREMLPGESFLEIRYEELVSEPERIMRRILAFLGLEWSECCLQPENSIHPISTPSVWQARQPVYRGSVGRWRRYRTWLGPLAQLIPASETYQHECEDVPS